MAKNNRVEIAAIADIHYGSTGEYPLPDFSELAAGADVLVVCGDLTDRGLPEEAEGLAKELSRVKIPIVTVMGNHDYEGGRQQEIQHILSEHGVTVLDGDACEIAGIGFAGAKGFAGGFGRRTLEPWGEPAIKAFVQEAANESIKLGSALARLRAPHIVVLTHYAPIQATVEGEPPEIFSFLGCSRLEEPLNRFPVSVAFHGHAHRGSPEGKTQSGVPVYNVSMPLLRRLRPDQPPVHRWEVTVEVVEQ